LQLTETKYDEINTRVSSNSKNECQLVAIKLDGKQLSSAAVASSHVHCICQYLTTIKTLSNSSSTPNTQHQLSIANLNQLPTI